MIEASPEKAGVGGSTPSLATTSFKHSQKSSPELLVKLVFATKPNEKKGGDYRPPDGLNWDTSSGRQKPLASWLPISTFAPVSGFLQFLTC